MTRTTRRRKQQQQQNPKRNQISNQAFYLNVSKPGPAIISHHPLAPFSAPTVLALMVPPVDFLLQRRLSSLSVLLQNDCGSHMCEERKNTSREHLIEYLSCTLPSPNPLICSKPFNLQKSVILGLLESFI